MLVPMVAALCATVPIIRWNTASWPVGRPQNAMAGLTGFAQIALESRGLKLSLLYAVTILTACKPSPYAFALHGPDVLDQPSTRN